MNAKNPFSYIRAARFGWAVMRKEILQFLKRERDRLAGQLDLLQRGEWEVVHVNSGRENITPRVAADMEARLLRFEELIAAYESRVG